MIINLMINSNNLIVVIQVPAMVFYNCVSCICLIVNNITQYRFAPFSYWVKVKVYMLIVFMRYNKKVKVSYTFIEEGMVA